MENAFFPDEIFAAKHKLRAIKIANVVKLRRKWHYATDFLWWKFIPTNFVDIELIKLHGY